MRSMLTSSSLGVPLEIFPVSTPSKLSLQTIKVSITLPLGSRVEQNGWKKNEKMFYILAETLISPDCGCHCHCFLGL